eukprot:SAG31_NODE_38968_length_291_cov_37.781250_1_plen_83_part_01
MTLPFFKQCVLALSLRLSSTVGQSPNVWCLVVFVEMSDLVFIGLHGYGFLELLIKISTPQTEFRTFAKPLHHPRCLTIPAITL